MNKNEYNDYKSLVCSIIEQQIYDFLHNSDIYRNKSYEKQKKIFTHYINNCRWFEYLDINKDVLLKKVLERKEELNNAKEKKKNK